MALNSNVFIPLGMPVTMRAELLGHDVSTNEKYYSFAEKDNAQKAADFLNRSLTPNLPLDKGNIINFAKRKTLKTANFQGFKIV